MNRPIPFADRLLARYDPPGGRIPFITVAIPHYKHRRYLEVVLDSIFEQSFPELEILVSDDCSPDDSNQIIPRRLQSAGRPFRYYAQSQNLGYDGNVRFCLAAAQGQYVFMLGNDDALAGPNVLQTVADELRTLNFPAVAFTSFADWETGTVTRRAQSTCLLGNGPETAIRFFRSLSFVSGLIFERSAAAVHETARWDRSVYYQIYLGSRIVASGGPLAALADCAVRKDVRLAGQTVPNYATKAAGVPWSLQPRHTGLDSVIRVTVDAVCPLVPDRDKSTTIQRIVSQILTISYPYWLFEYRRVANWSFAAGVAREMWPGKLLAEYELNWRERARLWLAYAGSTVVGLLFPQVLFHRIKSRLADGVRRRQQSVALRGHYK